MAFPDERASLSARSENDPAEPEQVYGPLRLRRYVKDDGRALILYAHGGSAQDQPANE